MSNEFNPQPIATPSVEVPQSWSAPQSDYEGRRRNNGVGGIVVEGEHEIALLFGNNGLQGPERIDHTKEVDTSAINDETLGYLQEAQNILDTWEDETPERAVVVGKIISVARRRDEVRESDRTKFRLFTEIMPLAQLERDQTDAELEEQRGLRDEANALLQQQHDVVDHHAGDAKTTQGLIDDAANLRKDTKDIREKYHQRYLELTLGRTSDGSEPEPLSDIERDQWIIDGMDYGPLDGTEPDANYAPNSPQEKERAKAVIMHIVSLYDAEIARVNGYINEQRQLRDEANARKRQAEMEQNARHEALLRAHKSYSDSEFMADEASDRYDEAAKLRNRIIGKPDESFGAQVTRELRQDQARAALNHAHQQHTVIFGDAGARSEADRLAGRAPLAIEGARVAVQGVAARLRIRGLGRMSEITVGYPNPKERE